MISIHGHCPLSLHHRGEYKTTIRHTGTEDHIPHRMYIRNSQKLNRIGAARIVCVCAGLLHLAACGTTTGRGTVMPTAPLPAIATPLEGTAVQAQAEVETTRAQRFEEGVTWRVALNEAFQQHPELLEADANLTAVRSEATAAGLRPNPSLAFDLEDFAGQGDLSGVRGAQSTLTYSQTIEGGNKREARKDLADLRSQVAESELQRIGQVLTSTTRHAFLQALGAQEALALALDTEQRMQAFELAVSARFEAGKASKLDHNQIRLAVSSASLQRRAAERRDQASKAKLAQCWGGEVDFEGIEGQWEVPQAPPTRQALQLQWEQSLAGRLVQQDLALGSAEATYLESERHSDWTVSFGLRRYEETDDVAAVIGLELPLRLFRSGRNAQEIARSRRRQAIYRAEVAEREVQRELTLLHARIEWAHDQIQFLDGGQLEEAQWGSRAVIEGYRLGRFDLAQAMQAERTYFELRGSRLAALVDYHLAWAELDELIGTAN